MKQLFKNYKSQWKFGEDDTGDILDNKNIKSYAYIIDDPDAVNGLWTHFICWNIPSNITVLNDKTLFDNNIIIGKNSWNNHIYEGPCPPPNTGIHHYVFTIYGLNDYFNISKFIRTKTPEETEDYSKTFQLRINELPNGQRIMTRLNKFESEKNKIIENQEILENYKLTINSEN